MADLTRAVLDWLGGSFRPRSPLPRNYSLMNHAPPTRLVPPVVLLTVALFLAPARGEDRQTPRSLDPRLVVELFAASPDIVHPIALDFDSQGRLLVVESHTHFRPPDYQGPAHDRIRVLEDTDGDGRADRFTSFFEGTTATMDLAVHPDGSVYVATRNEVLRLRDTNDDGQADLRERIVFLDTEGNYPHNGLSGLCFDARGDLYFGMGENLGVAYRLSGADGRTIAGGGEGGNSFWCTAEGKNLRRVATGFWNPFGQGTDVFGRLFAVDNDPDAMPPCRLLHVVEGADFGYQFRYGRSGRHVFQCWNGQIPGALPMIAGTGESPCEVISYESDGLPAEYRGTLLVPIWADHRVELFSLMPRGASFVAQSKPLVQGGQNFRPSGLSVAPDGSLFVGDWVRRDYQLHGQGAVWHIRAREADEKRRPADPRQALVSHHRPLRERAARQLAGSEPGRQFLRGQLAGGSVGVRAASLAALVAADDRQLDLRRLALGDPEVGIREMATREMAARGEDVRELLDARQPAAVRCAAIAGLVGEQDLDAVLGLLADGDPFLRNAAVHQLARHPDLLRGADARPTAAPRVRGGLLLAWRASGLSEAADHLKRFLADSDDEVRFLAVKWVADERLVEHRPAIAAALEDRRLNSRLYAALATALARLEGREASDARLAEYFLMQLADDEVPSDVRRRALQLVPATHARLSTETLAQLLDDEDVPLQREAVQALAERNGAQDVELLQRVVRDEKRAEAIRAAAIAGLSARAHEMCDDLVALAQGERPLLRDEALRALTSVELSAAQAAGIEQVAVKHPQSAELAARILGGPFAANRPPLSDVDAWLERLEGPADAEAGRRIFFHKVGNCARCHRLDGRGQEIGPDLSDIGRADRRHLVESILQPASQVAPHYQVWMIETVQGQLQSGILVRTHLDDYTYIDEKGDSFQINTRDIAAIQPASTSIMPNGLAEQLTDQELRDLLAFLEARR